MKIDRFEGFPAREIADRVGAAATAAAKRGLSGLLIMGHVDLYYFTGTAQKGVLFIPAGDGAGPGVLYILRDIDRARAESKFPSVEPLTRLRDLPAALARAGYGGMTSVGLELDVLPAKTYLLLTELFEGVSFVDASGLIRRIRAVKSPLERKLITTAAGQLVSLFKAVPSFFIPGAREIDIAVAAERHLRGLGHQGQLRLHGFGQELFFGVVVSGPSGAVASSLDGPVGGLGLSPAFPQGASTKLIGDTEAVLIDMVGAWRGYLADGARLFCRKGLVTKARDAYAASLAIEREIVRLARPGVAAGDLFAAAEKIADESGFGDHFMGVRQKRLSFVGHGVGLEVDELPVIARGSAETLAEGNVFALEPKFVFVDIGAVGVENTFFLGPAGPELLTAAPDEPVVIDAG